MAMEQLSSIFRWKGLCIDPRGHYSITSSYSDDANAFFRRRILNWHLRWKSKRVDQGPKRLLRKFIVRIKKSIRVSWSAFLFSIIYINFLFPFRIVNFIQRTIFKQPSKVPSGCEIRNIVAWWVHDDASKINSQSYLETNKFYGDTTRSCTVRDSNGRQRTVTFNDDPLVPPALWNPFGYICTVKLLNLLGIK